MRASEPEESLLYTWSQPDGRAQVAAGRLCRGKPVTIVRPSTERSAARLAHQSGGLGVPSSNLGAPTNVPGGRCEARCAGRGRSVAHQCRTVAVSVNTALDPVLAGQTGKCLPLVTRAVLGIRTTPRQQHVFIALQTHNSFVRAEASRLPLLIRHACPPNPTHRLGRTNVTTRGRVYGDTGRHSSARKHRYSKVPLRRAAVNGSNF